MATKRKTVDNDDLTIIVKETVFGVTSRYELVQNYSTSGEVTLLKSNNILDKEQVDRDARDLAKKLNVPIYSIK